VLSLGQMGTCGMQSERHVKGSLPRIAAHTMLAAHSQKGEHL